MAKIILPGQTIGIIGGGKNANLLTLKAQEMGYSVGLMTNHQNDLAIQAADWWMEQQLTNTDGVLELAGKSDVLLFVAEEVDPEIYSSLRPYIEFPQLTDTLPVTQDRLIEKVFLESLNINVSPYATITSIDDIKEAVQSIGYPCVLKSIRVEANQPKNVFLYSEEDFAKTNKLLATGACLLESWIPFEKELAVTLAVDAQQKITSFPIAETIYRDGKSSHTITPARIEADMQGGIAEIGNHIAAAMQMTGLLTIELFVTSVGTIYVKRLSVQPRNVTDFSLDACNVSQYEALIRTVCGLALPEVTLARPAITYYLDGEKMAQAIVDLPDHPEWHLRFYNREQKQGQITIFSQEEDAYFHDE